jgi:hypothetical protein
MSSDTASKVNESRRIEPLPTERYPVETILPEAKPDVTIYSREQLEAIADQEGIHGLRKVGDVLNVKGVSIRTLIEDILKAQDTL